MSSENQSAGAAPAKPAWAHWAVTALLAVAFILEIIDLCRPLGFSDQLVTLVFLLAVVSTLTGLVRQLPLQNVLLAALGIAVIGGAISLVGAGTGIPFGPVIYEIQPQWWKMPWVMPLVWVFVILNSRGVARLILRPWRKVRVYGFWLIGLTGILATAFDVALEPFARAKHFWFWMATSVPVSWQGAPLSDFFSWLALVLLILAFVTPALINKQLSKRSRSDFHPLCLWLGAIVIFAVTLALHQQWTPVIADAVVGGVTAAFAIRGAKW